MTHYIDIVPDIYLYSQYSNLYGLLLNHAIRLISKCSGATVETIWSHGDHVSQ